MWYVGYWQWISIDLQEASRGSLKQNIIYCRCRQMPVPYLRYSNLTMKRVQCWVVLVKTTKITTTFSPMNVLLNHIKPRFIYIYSSWISHQLATFDGTRGLPWAIPPVPWPCLPLATAMELECCWDPASWELPGQHVVFDEKTIQKWDIFQRIFEDSPLKGWRVCQAGLCHAQTLHKAWKGFASAGSCGVAAGYTGRRP